MRTTEFEVRFKCRLPDNATVQEVEEFVAFHLNYTGSISLENPCTEFSELTACYMPSVEEVI